ncbi:hypothetical protein SAMN05414139_06599 [Burkholderia sp. D7]|nr:hypothetical protein SAMN05414139_06599 [Burkholderia sp. D7]
MNDVLFERRLGSTALTNQVSVARRDAQARP